MKEQNTTPENLQNNKKRNLVIGIVSAIILAIILYFLFYNKQEKTPAENTLTQKDSLKKEKPKQDSAKIDSIKTTSNDEYDGEEEGYEPYSENYVIAKDAFLQSTPSTAETSKVKQLKFGEKIYVKNDGNTNSFATVYLTKPTTEKQPTEQPYYVYQSVLVSQYEFEEYKKYFSLSPFSDLASKTKKLVLDEDYNNGTQYYVTQNAERAKNVLSYGDYDKDGIIDIAIVLDNNEKQISRLLVICTNSVTKEPYLAFAENYSDKVKINSFKKGASVFMNSDDFNPSPKDGIMIKGEDIKLALIYNNNLQKFKTYYQE